MTHAPRNFKAQPYAYHQEVELVIADVNNLGVGVGRDNGWVVLVPFCHVGEKVRARIWRNHATYSEADLVEVLSASPERVAPLCPLYGVCGGCQYQHLSYSAQLTLKGRQLQELYRRLAGVEFPVAPTLPSPKPFAYRTKITPHYQPLREGADAFPIGFLSAVGRSLTDVPRCELATDAVNATYATLREETFAKCASFKKDGTLHPRESVREDGTIEVLTSPKAEAYEDVGGVRFGFVAGEFFQINRAIYADFSREVLQHIATPYVVDAYCGVGFFGLQAAKQGRCKEVAGVEVNSAAIALAQKNKERNGITNATFLLASAEAIFKELKFPSKETTVLLDPPRAGCSEDFLRQLIAYSPAKVVYVACDPSTQARDVKILTQGGYKLTSLRAMDLFPQTRHIEALAVLEK